MADYKELLRKAIAALPENNGAARRAVYEKARSALVGQLRAINPPLPARDITQHRLQLEDCIRQVEQEASEAVIAGLSSQYEEPRPAPPPKPAAKPAAPLTFDKRAEPEAEPAADSIATLIEKAQDEPAPAKSRRPAPAPEPEPEPEEAPVEAAKPEPEPKGKGGRPVPSIVARAEAAKSGTLAFGIPQGKPYEKQIKGPTLEPRREAKPMAAQAAAAPRFEPSVSPAATARAQSPLAVVEEATIAPAMSAVREVDLEREVPLDPQSSIDRAIATLDREARGETAPISPFDREAPEEEPAKPLFSLPGKRKPKDAPKRELPLGNERGFTRASPPPARERSGGNALTIFLLVFVVLLAGAGGAGFWAVQQGFLDPETMFASRAPAVEQAQTPTAEPAQAETPVPPTAEAQGQNVVPPLDQGATPAAPTTNTAAAPAAGNDRLVPEEQLTASTETIGTVPPELQAGGDEAKTEERLTGTNGENAAPTDTAAIDPAQMAGSQSLLLEASSDGTSGAIPFSGTVEWSRGTDEIGQPTLIGKANIPARNLSVDVLIRKNADPALPASHLMEINFNVSETFVGGSITQLPGVLLKNEELVQGTPLVGASARVVGNSFLFALSATPGDAATNQELLTSRKWMDFALIYGTGKRAIITLEKDEQADSLFKEVFTAWGNAPAPSGNG